jgi:hypothetical protein
VFNPNRLANIDSCRCRQIFDSPTALAPTEIDEATERDYSWAGNWIACRRRNLVYKQRSGRNLKVLIAVCMSLKPFSIESEFHSHLTGGMLRPD